MNQLDKILLFLRTVRYLTGEQIWHRSRRIIGQKWLRLDKHKAYDTAGCHFTAPVPLYLGINDVMLPGPWADEVAVSTENAQQLAELRFRAFDQIIALYNPADWHQTSISQLWRYQLHYFGYVQDLLIWAGSGFQEAAFAAFRQVATSWISGNEDLKGDGWHPYTISLRLVNWLHAISFFNPSLQADQHFYQRLMHSLLVQAHHLAANLELDVRGNHLLENIRALCWLGIAFKGDEPTQWYGRGLALLEQEVEEQILSDGGHFERTPGYHLVVLKNLLEIAIWLQRNRAEVPPWLNEKLVHMLDFLLVILPPGGSVPLFKDTAWNGIPDAYDLLCVAAVYFRDSRYKLRERFGSYPLLVLGQYGWQIYQQLTSQENTQVSKYLSASGWAVIRDDKHQDYCIVDVGKPCPDYLPAHAHADLLSYELSVAGERIIVDSGVYEYQAGPWRDYFRSTRAHNTVEIENQNQSEVWSSFRVARRAKPQGVRWQETAQATSIEAEHDGYKRIHRSIFHRRKLIAHQAGFWLFIDNVGGTEPVSFINYLHLHPSYCFKSVGSRLWEITGAKTELWLTAFGFDNAFIWSGQKNPTYQGWYSEGFGQRTANQVLALYQAGKSSTYSVYMICKHQPGDIDVSVESRPFQFTVTYRQNIFRFP